MNGYNQRTVNVLSDLRVNLNSNSEEIIANALDLYLVAVTGRRNGYTLELHKEKGVSLLINFK